MRVSVMPRSEVFHTGSLQAALQVEMLNSQHYVGDCGVNFSVGLHTYSKWHCKLRSNQIIRYVMRSLNTS